jgi:hypothetical protein
MPLAGFEPASELLQTHTLDLAGTGIGSSSNYNTFLKLRHALLKKKQQLCEV